MKKIFYTMRGTFAAKALSLVLFAVLGFANAIANTNTLSIEDFYIHPGGDKVVDLCLDNDNNVSSLEANIVLPEGITITKYVINQERLDRDEHQTSFKQSNDGSWRCVILGTNNNNIIGNEGALLSVTFHAASDYLTVGSIRIKDMEFATFEDGKVVTYKPAEFIASVSPIIGTLSVVETMNVRPDSAYNYSVTLNNELDVKGMSLAIQLPEGMNIEKKANGKLKFNYGDRLPSDAQITYNERENGVFVVISALSHESFAGSTGTVFSFNVIVDSNLAETSEISINDAKISIEKPNATATDPDISATLESKKTVVTNLYIVYYKPEMDVLASLKAKLQATVDSIAVKYSNVKDNFVLVSMQNEISASIVALTASVEAAYIDGSIVNSTESFNNKVAEIEAAITKLLADAKLACEKAELTAAYDLAKSYADNLALEYNAAIEVINTDYANVANTDAILSEEAAISMKIAEFATAIDAAYADGTLASQMAVYEAMTAEIRAAIAALLVDAEVASEKAAELTAAYDLAKSYTDSLTAEYDSAVAVINREYTLVANSEIVLTAEDEVVAKITDFVSEIEAAYVDGTVISKLSAYEEKTSEIRAAIAGLLEIAKNEHITTGINGVSSSNEIVNYYNLAGQKVSTITNNGIYIVKYSNGETKKVLVK